MKLLEQRILKDGQVYPGSILKVDSFLNHQIDVKLLNAIGEEIKRLYELDAPNIIIINKEDAERSSHLIKKCTKVLPT